MLRGELEEVDVDVTLDGYGCSGVLGVNGIYCCLYVFGQLFVLSWSSVEVDDGVDWVGFGFVFVYLYYYRGYFWYGDVSHYSGVDVLSAVYCYVFGVCLVVVA